MIPNRLARIARRSTLWSSSPLSTTGVYPSSYLQVHAFSSISYQQQHQQQNQQSQQQQQRQSTSNVRSLLYAFSLGSLFGWKYSHDEQLEALPERRKNKQPIVDFDGALEWYQTYYILPDQDNFVQAIALLIGKESHNYLKQQLTAPSSSKSGGDNHNVRIQTIQSFYYFPMVGFMAEMFRQNPTKVKTWYDALMSREDITTPWRASSLGSLDPSMLLALAVSMAGSQECLQIQEAYVRNTLGKGASDERVKQGVDSLRRWSEMQSDQLPTYPLIRIGEYFCTGKESIIEDIASTWRTSLQHTNDNNQQQQNRDMIINELNHAIKLLAKDAKATKILQDELTYHLTIQKSSTSSLSSTASTQSNIKSPQLLAVATTTTPTGG
ncbi:hypothetical protein SAMD00019534_053290 [Acytostelium subglobosum LB1]|uniref:hypothetical protein n=1 Tax=Acytostelium subglobosum LB1 TaxID=1410327 RepID=UPI000644E3E6|nr:hypothetical protein SAMD00019534_053290 [Acytostelium subglobosum LB1]GAM22154.1 hypothetical protein SAMD00019534_053290 [Acytostelium subglobosum LB1]|eukprot:XP_012755254.1 hypothetical protein SAMD00019534_053290 [Acytostelium subglobosum LB1]